MIELAEMQAMALDSFIAERWDEFKQHCQQYDADADEISEALIGR